jgi:signal recognition particle subunit SRP54
VFGTLTEKMYSLLEKFSKDKVLSEENISDAIRQIRMALLDADVNFKVVSSFIKRVKEKALGEKVLKSVTAGQQFTELLHAELVDLMGNEQKPLFLKSSPSVVMLCGLQGSGKTSTCAKLAKSFSKSKKVLLAACDLQRPAAIKQLEVLSKSTGASFFSLEDEKDPVKVAKKSFEKAKKEGFDLLIVDTAGRLHIDEALMKELKNLKNLLTPDEVLFVANANTGQDAVKTAQQFDGEVGITGSILTMLDGNARAGAALSILEVTKKPLKYEGIGEKIEDLQPFNPKSMADRILGMGDVINLVRKAKENIDENESKNLENKLKKASFHYNDYLKMMGMMKKMGSLKGILKMMPGFSSIKDLEVPEDEFKYFEAAISSMTLEEREERVELTHMRRKRIADGSGVKVEQFNKLVKNFKRAKQLFKGMKNLKKSGIMDGLSEMKSKLGSKKWD